MAHAGGYPSFQKVSVKKTKSGRDSRVGLYETNLGNSTFQYDLTSGWVPKRQDGWLKGAELNKGSAMGYRMLTGTDGKRRRVYYLKGYDRGGWHTDSKEDQDRYRHSGSGQFGWYSGSPMATKILETEELSFSGEPGKDYLAAEAREGHIQKIEYNADTHMMRVTFGGRGGPNGVAGREDICLFYPTPDEVAGHLMKLAESGATHGHYETGDRRAKHTLGVEFWNLVRIRGQREGSKIPFEYKQHGAYKLTGRGDRYTVKLTAKNIELITGKKHPEYKPGDIVTTVLTPEELDRFRQIVVQDSATRSSNSVVQMKSVRDETGNVRMQETSGYYEDYDKFGNVIKGGEQVAEKTDSNIFKGLLSGKELQNYEDMERTLDTAINSKVAKERRDAKSKPFSYVDAEGNRLAVNPLNVIGSAEQAASEAGQAFSAVGLDGNVAEANTIKGKYRKLENMRRQAQAEYDALRAQGFSDEVIYKKFGVKPPSGSFNYDMRYRDLTDKASAQKVSAQFMKDALEKQHGEGAYAQYRHMEKREHANEAARSTMGKVWTKQDLRDFAKLVPQGRYDGFQNVEHYRQYKQLIDDGKYASAWNFLKNCRREVKDPTGKVILTPKYAGEHSRAVLSMDDYM